MHLHQINLALQLLSQKLKVLLTTKKIDQDTANNIRAKIVRVLNRPVHAHNNLSPFKMKALKELRKNQNIVILPADKGRATIILDTRDYDN